VFGQDVDALNPLAASPGRSSSTALIARLGRRPRRWK
jgi:hypothetical protein